MHFSICHHIKCVYNVLLHWPETFFWSTRARVCENRLVFECIICAFTDLFTSQVCKCHKVARKAWTKQSAKQGALMKCPWGFICRSSVLCSHPALELKVTLLYFFGVSVWTYRQRTPTSKPLCVYSNQYFSAWSKVCHSAEIILLDNRNKH